MRFILCCLLTSSFFFATAQSRNPLHERILSVQKTSFDDLEWTFTSKGKIFSSPVVHQGKVLFGSGDSTLYALDVTNGRQVWAFKTRGAVHSSPALYDNNVYVGSMDGHYYCVDTNTGKELWRFKTGGEHWPGGKGYFGWKPDNKYLDDPWDYFLSTPLIEKSADSVTVYFGSSDKHVYAVDALSGKLRWKFKTEGIVHTTPAVHDGILYVGSWDTYLYALDAATGKKLWKFKTGENPGMTGIQSSPTVASGSVFFGARDANLYCLDAKTGAKRWQYAAQNAWILSTPVMDNKTIYVGTSDSFLLLALSVTDGTEVWRSKLNGYVFGTPCVTENSIFIGDFTGKLYAIEKTTGKIASAFNTDSSTKNRAAILKPDGTMDFGKLAEGKDPSLYRSVVEVMDLLYKLGPIVSSPTISDNKLFFGSSDGKLYAVGLK